MEIGFVDGLLDMICGVAGCFEEFDFRVCHDVRGAEVERETSFMMGL